MMIIIEQFATENDGHVINKHSKRTHSYLYSYLCFTCVIVTYLSSVHLRDSGVPPVAEYHGA